MALFDALISDIATRFGLGSMATPLVRDVLKMVTGQPQGLTGFVEKLKSVGLGSEITSWLGNGNAAALPAQLVEGALGSSFLSGLASKFGLSSSVLAPILGYAVPKLIGLITPGGVVPTTLPAAVTSFLSAAEPAKGQVKPERIDVFREPKTTRNPWVVPALLGVCALGIGAWLLNSKTPERMSATATGVSGTVIPALTMPAQLSISDENGVIHYAGAVHDESTRRSTIATLQSAFGADKLLGDITVDPQRDRATWLASLGAALEHFKISGLKASFSGPAIRLGGIPESEYNQLHAYLKSLYGVGSSIGVLGAVDPAVANAKVAAALASFKSGFSANDLLGVMNMSVINFPTSGYELPTSEITLLQQAAGLIKQLPAGTVVEIAGYTDNTGDSTANEALSQNRAEAIRKALVDAGINGSALVARGYGEAYPVAPNDNEDGRASNRRIEYHVVK